MSASRISLPIKTQAGQDTGRVYEFDASELADGISKQLLHDAAVMYESNLRQGTFKSKTRSEVAGSSKKLFKQKGTGNARQGNKRQPVRRGGGHAFAKRPRDFSYRLPRKALRIATRMALLSKFLDQQVVLLDALSLEAPKTKVIAGMLKSLGLTGKSCTLATDVLNAVVYKSARNIPGVGVVPAPELNSYELLRRRHLVLTTSTLDQLRKGSPTKASA